MVKRVPVKRARRARAEMPAAGMRMLCCACMRTLRERGVRGKADGGAARKLWRRIVESVEVDRATGIGEDR
jgi:hypothetical protein